ncbi:hypothetical protein RFH42_16310 [Acinetobacter rudis]|uniref:hypothetical protein n=1 Tax=Acinetobacter rudis TaxID=632955 RepID=UPI00280F8682|nr:hypothetical protein [Acinetobacter rudis]MDQ8954514.1 hypothetical protein [Acinetobacter rudis]
MYLEQLIIKDKNGLLIREVEFKLGLNIVLGIKTDGQGSTNSLGKTTLLRAIDFCMDGKYPSFYQDDENKNVVNKDVLNFLKKSEPKFSLKLTKSLKHKSSFNITFSRQLISKPTSKNPNAFKIIHFINDEIVDSKYYSFSLQEVLFKSKTEKPSFRQLITKFIRKDDEQVSKILRYYPFCSDVDYENIHFTLFGYQNPKEIEKKLFQEKAIKNLKEKIKVVDTLKPIGIEQIISVNQNTLEELTQKRDSFKINEKYNYEEDELAKLNQKIFNIDNNISDLELNKEILINRLDIIRTSDFKDNSKTIELIYKEAQMYNIDLQKKFEQTVIFHNRMIENEKLYLEKRIQKINKKIENLQDLRTDFTVSYSNLLDNLSQNGSLAQYTQLNNEINELSKKISENNALQLQSISLNNELELLKKHHEETISLIESNINNFKVKNINIFNEYFSKYSMEIYNQVYVLAFDKYKDIYKFEISAVESNVGSGKKQALVIAFDLAYSAFIQDTRINLPYPRFSTQDKVEIIDSDNLQKLAELANSANCQLIFPLIEDKSLNLKLEDSVRLILSQENQFFNIEKYQVI